MTKAKAIEQCKQTASMSKRSCQFYAVKLDGEYEVISFDELRGLRRQNRDCEVIHAEYGMVE